MYMYTIRWDDDVIFKNCAKSEFDKKVRDYYKLTSPHFPIGTTFH